MTQTYGKMAERPEDLNLPNSVVARIIKDAVSFHVSMVQFNIFVPFHFMVMNEKDKISLNCILFSVNIFI